MSQGIHRNIPLFIAFRVLFNARFYYPVLGVLFIDLGLSLAEYAILNAIWAAAIILLEIPSGALADAIGRKTMVVLAACLMVLEMGLLIIAPIGGGAVLFWILVFNRLVGGAAEASASGADEALAYDSLEEGDRDEAWRKVLARLMQWQSAGFFAAMLLGAACYDRELLAETCRLVGFSFPDWPTTKWPIYLTAVCSVTCLFIACMMREPANCTKRGLSMSAAVGNIARGALAIWHNGKMFRLFLALLLCDSFVRLFLTFSSNYVRVIDLPAWVNGPMGATMALLGFLAAWVGRSMTGRHKVRTNFALLMLMILFGLLAVSLAIPTWGLLAVVPLGLSMSLVGFFGSYYLNKWAENDVRATILSFRGVALNLGYGAIGLAFSALTARIATAGAGPNEVFREAIGWLPSSFVVAVLIGMGVAGLHHRFVAATPRAGGAD